MNDHEPRIHSLDALPKAIIGKNWKSRLFWLVPLAAAAIAGFFIYSEVFSDGPTVHIYFKDAQNLEAGKSEVKYRGAQIGIVKALKLTKDHQSVDVSVSLNRGAMEVAREGSRFWIVRPQVGLAQIQGLGTIVSGNFITVDPGRGTNQTTFQGLAEAPVLDPEGAIRIVLLAERLGGVKERAPVFYRGIQIGQIFKCQLGPESQTIHILADIRTSYAPLVRMNSKFWNAGGIHVNIGLSGADISAQSAETLISGGVDLATPDISQKPVVAGTAFRLYDKPKDAWLGWAPHIQLEETSKSPEFSQISR
jgi:paraquat-inducible protein B